MSASSATAKVRANGSSFTSPEPSLQKKRAGKSAENPNHKEDFNQLLARAAGNSPNTEKARG